MKTHVETFHDEDGGCELERKINRYCETYGYAPVSISVVCLDTGYDAYVVVKEDGDG